MTSEEPQHMYKSPTVVGTSLPRTYQYVSLMESTVKSRDKPTTQDPLGWKVLNLYPRSDCSKYATVKPNTSDWLHNRHHEKVPEQMLSENRNFVFPTWGTRYLLTDTSNLRDTDQEQRTPPRRGTSVRHYGVID